MRRVRQKTVVKITMWDGSEYYTDNQDANHIRRFIERADALFRQEERKAGRLGQLDVLEMTGREYREARQNQPANAGQLFGEE